MQRLPLKDRRKGLGIGIIGCGAIGTTIAKAIDKGSIPNSKLVTVFDQFTERIEGLSKILQSKFDIARSFEDLVKKRGVELVVEAASQKAVKEYGVKVLQRRKKLLIMSVGALLDTKTRGKIIAASRRYGVGVYVISGALAGIDAVRAAKIGGLDEVILTTRKNPISFIDSPYLKEKRIDVKNIREPLLLYDGSALEAVRHFPANVNVAATLSLAGLGAEKTKVRVIADPSITINIHEVIVKGSFGTMNIVMQNVPQPDNPKSSYLAALSAIETIKSISNKEIRIGT